MTSFDQDKGPVRPEGKGGAFTVAPVTGLDDPLASDAGRALMRFFHERTGGKRLLKRSDFSPTDIKEYLTNIVIMDMVYGEDGLVCDGRIRVMGTNVATYYGEYTGRLISEHPTDTGERFVMGALAAVASKGPVIGRADQSSPDKSRLSVKTCWIPIINDDGEITQILGHIQLFRLSGEPVPTH